MPNRVRHERVRELLKREIGEVIRRELPISEAGLVNVNQVEVSGDLHNATVYVGIIGKAEQRKRALALLEQQRKQIQWQLGRNVVLKYTPVLRLIQDDSIQRRNKVPKTHQSPQTEKPTP